jgi:hypothetical protein
MKEGFFVVEAYALGEGGARIKNTFTMFDDPGYRDTARLVAESALTIFYEDKNIKVNFLIYRLEEDFGLLPLD